MMKSLKGTQRSCSSRLNRARRNAIALASMIEKIDTKSADFWCELRSLTETISQCVHEANAYNNVAMGGALFSESVKGPDPAFIQTVFDRVSSSGLLPPPPATPEASE